MDARRQRRQRGAEPLDSRFDQWIETGRQLVDGVSGTRPGRRGGGRPQVGSRLDAVGRWVGDRVDWLLDEDDDWSEGVSAPEPSEAARPRPSGKRPLDAMSRRQPLLMPPTETSPLPSEEPAQGDWPDDEDFRVERWRRSESTSPPAPIPESRASVRRSFPRSSRRRDGA
ncbi:viral RNA helicase/ superfamily I [Synechococcus sp. MEDNS5]|uniref:RNA helicase n=1 Tax=Synechococcus sp. MEDNS5 TaxID=1442554 RepID=UPI001648003F|nr:RNA helicase [Synechococcus sp. MEDNS5]QNJ07345.1 viral RNA helicase/ superfamily I [Synechococcus sp. MEDNS5]